MSKKTILISILVIVVLLLAYWFYQKSQAPQSNPNFVLDAKNCIYEIEGEDVTLKDGQAEEALDNDLATKTITRYFGNEVAGYFNDDEFSDRVFLLTQDGGGSGTFYYVAAALGSANKCLGTRAILLGDRIAPQTTEFRNGEIIVNYADRKPDEAMTTSPSVGVSRYFVVRKNSLVEIKK